MDCLAEVWSRRSFIKAGATSAGMLLMTSDLTELMAGTDPTELSIRAAGDLVRKKAISPVELTRACLQRIERLNPALNVSITVTAEEAMAQAREAEAEVWRGRWRDRT